MNAKKAADFCGLSVKGFHAWIKRCGLKIKVKNSNLYDIKALGIALDRLSGIVEKPSIEIDKSSAPVRKVNRNALFPSKRQQGRQVSLS